MSGLAYVGVDPSAGRDTENRINTEGLLTSGVSRSYVQSRTHTLAAPYATKTYVDTQDAQFSSQAYYSARDALLTPNAAAGAASGIASLDGSGKVPPAQVPVLGVGILKGPIPVTSTGGGSTFDVPIQIGQWQLGAVNYTCEIWVFMAVAILSVGGRPVVEVRAGPPSATTYAAQSVIAAGYGRTFYNDYQSVEVFPVDPNLGDVNGSIQAPYTPLTNLNLTAWMFDGAGGQVTTQAGLVVNASAYLARTTL